MKRALVVLALVVGMTATANAQVPITAKGDAMRLDTARLPQPMKANYEILREKCTRCHTMERIVLPFQTGITPITGQPFDMDAMKSITFNMVRKSNAKSYPISKEEAKSISVLLKYLLDESVK